MDLPARTFCLDLIPDHCLDPLWMLGLTSVAVVVAGYSYAGIFNHEDFIN